MTIAVLYRDELREYDFGPGHPFRGDRYEIFPNFLQQNVAPDDRYRIIAATPAADDDLLLICNKDYVDFTRRFYRAAHDGVIDSRDFGRYHSTDNMPLEMPGNIEEAARLVVGQAKYGCDLIQSGTYRKAVSIGGGVHHAKASYGEGFCLYNDVAYAARYLIDHYRLERVLILDTDAHAGNGTCDYFAADPRVLFIDLHQDPRTLYPGTGFAGDIGVAEGKGFTVNVPLPPGTGYDSYERIFAEIVEPLAREFKPQFMIRNGGSDPHPDDGLTDLNLPVKGFRMIGEQVRSLADELCAGRELDLIASGYNERILPYCWLALIAGLAGWDIDIHEPGSPARVSRGNTADDRTTIIEAEIKNNLRPYWQCFR